jgi:branched-chain amino acid aminotransferase
MNDDVRVWVDGAMVGPGQPAIAALDHGVTVGDGVFETCKVVDGQGFALTRHARRLDRSLAGLGLPAADHDVIAEGIAAVLSGAPIPFGRLRYSITGGAGPLGSDRSDSSLTYIVTAGPQPLPPAHAKVVVVPWTRNERSATAGLKTTSYAENVVALAYARERGGTEAVFANLAGNLCEGTGSNVAYVVAGELRTPSLESGCLAGITRALLLEWCGAREMDEPIAVLDDAEEIMLVSTTRDVQAVTRYDGRELTPGPVTAQCQKEWVARAAENIDP